MCLNKTSYEEKIAIQRGLSKAKTRLIYIPYIQLFDNAGYRTELVK